MRSTLSVHRSASISRLAYGASSRRRPPALSNQKKLTEPAFPVEAIAGSGAAVNLSEADSPLPLNLLRYLARKIEPGLEDDLLSLTHHSDEAPIRRLARAIRCLSKERLREPWSEYSFSLARLQTKAQKGAELNGPIILCLRCGQIAKGPEAEAAHTGDCCVQVKLLKGGTSPIRLEDSGTVGIRQAIGNFRRGRAAAGLPHYDLDCYVSGGELVFTWRAIGCADRPASAAV